MPSGVSYSGSTLARGIRQYSKKTRDRMKEIMEDFAQEMVAYAQSHAPWEDRTGEARLGLGASVSDGFSSWSHDAIEIVLFHGVDYGIWLEVRWGGKYAIILPTLEAMGPELMGKFDFITARIIYYV